MKFIETKQDYKKITCYVDGQSVSVVNDAISREAFEDKDIMMNKAEKVFLREKKYREKKCRLSLPIAIIGAAGFVILSNVSLGLIPIMKVLTYLSLGASAISASSFIVNYQKLIDLTSVIDKIDIKREELTERKKSFSVVKSVESTKNEEIVKEHKEGIKPIGNNIVDTNSHSPKHRK